MGQYEDEAWLSRAQSRSRTIHNRFGSWAKASKAVGVTHNTLRSWARGDTKPKPEQLTRMNRMVGQYRHSESAMKTITETSVRQNRIADRRTIRVARDKGIISERVAKAELKATPLVTKSEAERVADLFAYARDTGSADDYKLAKNAYDSM